MRKDKDIFPIINKKETAKRLKYLMTWNHLKPADVQKYLGLTCVQTVYRWLEGINIPSIDNLYALSQLFNIKVDDMLEGSRQISEMDQRGKQPLRLIAYYTKLNFEFNDNSCRRSYNLDI
jgi:transcriptional regulator with XRE-family HTH domain